jgi:hypothetical protein
MTGTKPHSSTTDSSADRTHDADTSGRQDNDQTAPPSEQGAEARRRPTTRRARQTGRRLPEPPPPSSLETLRAYLDETYEWVWGSADRHQVLASRWNALDSWARLFTALAASLSALTLFADNTTMTAVFAVTTAIVAALNAAWGPAKRAQAHTASYKGYCQLLRPLSELQLTIQTGTRYVPMSTTLPDGTVYDAGYYEQVPMSQAQLANAWRRLQVCEDDLDAVREDAPVFNRLFGGDGVPRTRWGVWRTKRRLERRREIDALYAEDSKERASVPPPYQAGRSA